MVESFLSPSISRKGVHFPNTISPTRFCTLAPKSENHCFFGGLARSHPLNTTLKRVFDGGFEPSRRTRFATFSAKKIDVWILPPETRTYSNWLKTLRTAPARISWQIRCAKSCSETCCRKRSDWSASASATRPGRRIKTDPMESRPRKSRRT